MNVDDFNTAYELCRMRADAVKYALVNIEGVKSQPEAVSVAFLGRFDVVYAVWIEPTEQEVFSLANVKFRQIKGPMVIVPKADPMLSDLHTLNAVPVADEAEAKRWSALLSKYEADQQPGIRLATDDGERIS